MYDYLIVGSGLFGSVFTHEATARGKKVLVIERRDHTGGNIYCENIGGEMAKIALQNDCKELYSLLKNSGKSFVVKFKIPYLRISDYRKDDVVFSFISYYAIGGDRKIEPSQMVQSFLYEKSC